MIGYEWVYEETDENGDIIDPLFADTLKEVLLNADGEKYDIALVLNEGDVGDGLTFRDYAYIKNSKLPTEFPCGYKIPKKFHAEVRRIG